MIAAIPLLIWDLDASDGGFVSGGSTGQWEWGVPAGGPGGSAHLWGTNLDGPYLNDAVDTLEIALPDLSAATSPVLVLRHWYDVLTGDAGTIEIDDGSGWRQVEPIYGYPTSSGFVGSSGGYVDTSVDLSGLGEGARLRLVFSADPVLAADGWYVSGAGIWDGDVTAPRVDAYAVPADTDDVDGPYPVVLDVLDDTAVAGVDVEVTIDGATQTFAASRRGDGRYEADIPGQPAGTTVSWHAIADDGAQTGRWPTSGDTSFRVALPAPTDLQGPTGRIVDGSVTLTWAPPATSRTIDGYEVSEDGGAPIATTATTANVPVTASGEHRFAVRAVYDSGPGDWSDDLVLDVEVPVLFGLEPASALQGDAVHLTLTGTSLYLEDGATLDLGDGVTVDDVEVLDVGTLRAVATVDAGADVGARPARVRGAFGEYVFPGAFAVEDGADRPHVVSIDPADPQQGWAGTITVEASQKLAGPVDVVADPDVVVSSDVTVDGATATFGVVVSGSAAPGDHVLILDDGQRLWTATIEVKERVVAPQHACSTAGVGGEGVGWLALAVLPWLRRRRRC